MVVVSGSSGSNSSIVGGKKQNAPYLYDYNSINNLVGVFDIGPCCMRIAVLILVV